MRHVKKTLWLNLERTQSWRAGTSVRMSRQFARWECFLSHHRIHGRSQAMKTLQNWSLFLGGKCRFSYSIHWVFGIGSIFGEAITKPWKPIKINHSWIGKFANIVPWMRQRHGFWDVWEKVRFWLSRHQQGDKREKEWSFSQNRFPFPRMGFHHKHLVTW